MKKNTKKKETLLEKARSLPSAPGVYIFKGKTGQPLYVGKALNLTSRVRQYFGKNSSHKGNYLTTKVKTIDYVTTGSETEALILECNLIKKWRPRYNILLKDNKKYPFIKITVKEDFPRIFVVRKKEKDGNLYLGPFPQAKMVRRSIHEARGFFNIRSCDLPLKEGKKYCDPCLEYHIKRCEAPCDLRVNSEQYKKGIEGAIHFLQGEDNKVVNLIKTEMEKASDAEDYNRAIHFRNLLQSLEHIREKQVVFSDKEVSRDVLGIQSTEKESFIVLLFIRKGRMLGRREFVLDNKDEEPKEVLLGFLTQYYFDELFLPERILLPFKTKEIEEWIGAIGERRGQKFLLEVPRRGEGLTLMKMAHENAVYFGADKFREKAISESELESLKSILGLPRLPSHIEGIDISHHHGVYTVGSLVVFKDGVKASSDYRIFKIRQYTNNDPGSISEVVARRYKRLADEGEAFPDLLLIDGGIAQLESAQRAYEAMGFMPMAIISLAKRFEEIHVPGSPPLKLPRRHPALKLLMKVRDESHRFANTFHGKGRSKSLRSIYSEVPGIGEKKTKALLKSRIAPAEINSTDRKQLLKLGLSDADVKQLKKHFAKMSG